MSAGCFVVRSVVADPAIRQTFDAWYQDEHLPDAIAAFKATGGWRAWSETDPSVHYAYYELTSVEAAAALVGSEALARLIVDFDARWQGRVVRTREVLRVAGPGAKASGTKTNR